MALSDDKQNSTYQFPATLVDLVIEIVDRSMPRCGDPLLDLGEAKTRLANHVPMSEMDVALWMVSDRLQEEIKKGTFASAPAFEPPKKEPQPAQRYGKAFTIQTGRGKKIVLIEDVKISVSA
ncbi:MAG TPA: hypothetical protein VHW45_11565, partial [Candidatus Sulfotelmatobacter sp.]|nr:hypothetical protein [Candidatus Sulfotelmatobacter sp.]